MRSSENREEHRRKWRCRVGGTGSAKDISTGGTRKGEGDCKLGVREGHERA